MGTDLCWYMLAYFRFIPCLIGRLLPWCFFTEASGCRSDGWQRVRFLAEIWPSMRSRTWCRLVRRICL